MFSSLLWYADGLYFVGNPVDGGGCFSSLLWDADGICSVGNPVDGGGCFSSSLWDADGFHSVGIVVGEAVGNFVGVGGISRN